MKEPALKMLSDCKARASTIPDARCGEEGMP